MKFIWHQTKNFDTFLIFSTTYRPNVQRVKDITKINNSR